MKIPNNLARSFLRRHPDAWLLSHPEHITLILLLKLGHPTEPPPSVTSIASDLGISRQHAYRRLASAGVKVQT